MVIEQYRYRPRHWALSSALVLAASIAVLVAISTPTTSAMGDASDLNKAETAISQGDYKQAAQLLHPLAEANNVQAQVDLASLTLSGKDVGVKPDQAIAWLTSAAENGNGPAAALLGFAYAKGKYVPHDDAAAYRWLTRASESTQPSADALTVAKSNRDAVMTRLTPAERDAALAGPDEPKPAIAAPVTTAMPASTATKETPSTTAISANDKPADAATAAKLASAETKTAPSVKPESANDKPTQTATAAKPASTTTKATQSKAAGSPKDKAIAVSQSTMDAQSAGKSPVFHVQIASLPTLQSAQAEWKRLQHKYPALLGGQQGQISSAELDDKRKRFHILIGAFEDGAAAQQLCSQLKDKGQNCLITIALPAPAK